MRVLILDPRGRLGGVSTALQAAGYEVPAAGEPVAAGEVVVVADAVALQAGEELIDAPVVVLAEAPVPVDVLAGLGPRLAGCLPLPPAVDRLLEAVAAAAERSGWSRRGGWRATVDAIQDPIAVADRDGHVLRANRAFVDRFGDGADDLGGRLDVELLYGSADSLAEHPELRTGFITYETSELTAPGTFLVSHYPVRSERGICYVYHLADVTAQKQAQAAVLRSEAHLRQSQKLEVVGRLAGGVVHDFNNLLTAVIGAADMLLFYLEPGTEEYETAAHIQDAAQRGAALTRQLLGFTRSQVSNPEVIDLGAFLADLRRLLQRLVGEDIELRLDVEPGAACVEIDRVQLDQVILNLAVNARDAMPGGGKLALRMWVDRPGDGEASVRLSIADTGEGMTEEIRQRAMEPFFTTKPAERGTGLGLATVRSIIEEADGEIALLSSPKQGTTVELWLPAAEGPASDARSDESTDRLPLRRGGEAMSRGETVLLVEDDDSVRRVLRGALEAGGYQVLEAASAQAALGVAEHHRGGLELLLSDLVMPGASGVDLQRQLVERYPQIRVLLMSGYAPSTTRDREAIEQGMPFLPKPFSADALVRKVREVLDAGDS